jgi:dienelactone hydrolase
MPVILWANGGCGATGTAWMSPLIEWASHGIMVIADGSPSGSGRDTSALLKKSLDWLDTIGSNPKYAFVDITRVGVAGQSCGGLLAYDLEGDKRIKTVGIFNSGALNAQQQKMPPNFTKPIAYFLGGSSDIAYKQV